jgi:anti-sigma factor RsiW
MIDRDSPVTEDELHAYVDGELPTDRKAAVAAWLAEHPEQAALVATWRAQAESIRAHFGTAVDEPVPQRLKLDQVLRHGQANGRSWWRSRLDGAWRICRGPEQFRYLRH